MDTAEHPCSKGHLLAPRQTAVLRDFDGDPRGPMLSVVHVAALSQHAVVHCERARAGPIPSFAHLVDAGLSLRSAAEYSDVKGCFELGV